MDPGTTGSWLVMQLKANTPRVQELLRAVPLILDSALVNPLKTVQVPLNYTVIVTTEDCDNQQYLYKRSIYLPLIH